MQSLDDRRVVRVVVRGTSSLIPHPKGRTLGTFRVSQWLILAGPMEFEWDAAKDEANRRRHGISFSEARELFESGVGYLEIYDAAHSGDEDRFIAVGPIHAGLIVVVYTERLEATIRVISARQATRAEVALFRRRIGDEA